MKLNQVGLVQQQKWWNVMPERNFDKNLQNVRNFVNAVKKYLRGDNYAEILRSERRPWIL